MSAPTRFSYLFEGFRLDPIGKVLFRGDAPVSLTPKTIETLLALVERPGQVVTKEELLRTVWPDAFVEENNLAQHISTLRRVLGEDEGGRQLIETMPKRGYRFVGRVTRHTDDDAGQPQQASEPAHPPPADEAGQTATSESRTTGI